MRLIDTHCHLYEEPLAGDLSAVLQRARAVGVEAFVVVGTTLQTSRRAVALAQAHSDVWAAVGLHPDAQEPLDIDALAELLGMDRVVAVGEIGLDGSQGKHRLETQEPLCRSQLALARDHGLPALIHSRDATGRLLELLRSFGPDGPGGILHAWGGSQEVAQQVSRLGFALGVAGVVCRPQATRIRRMVSELALDSLVLETDAPYIGTATHPPGQVEPAQVRQVCDALAELHGTDPDTVAATTTTTARRLLRLS